MPREYEDDDRFDEKPRMGDREAALKRVRPAAIWLQIGAFVSILVSLVLLSSPYVLLPKIAEFYRDKEASAPEGAEKDMWKLQAESMEKQVKITKITQPIFSTIGVALALAMIIGASHMKKLGSYGWAMAGCICGCIPLVGCCLLTVPFAIWGLVVITKVEVKSQFRAKEPIIDEYDRDPR